MARLTAANDPTPATLEEACEALRVWGFDPAEEESVAHAAHWLARLGNNREFLGDVLIDFLTRRNEAGSAAFDAAEPNRIVLAEAGRGSFSLSASIWPGLDDPILQDSGPEAFAYGLAHDHNHDFLVLGYFGPGLEFEDHEYDYGAVAGWPGEPVALTSLGRSVLEPGQLAHYRAHRDIHRVHAPRSLSVTMTLAHENAATGWMDHYLFDLDRSRIAHVLGHGPSEAFLRIAVALGGEEAMDLAERFGRHHPSDRMRLTAWRALAGNAGTREAQDALWRRAEGSGSRVVAAAAAARRVGLSG